MTNAKDYIKLLLSALFSIIILTIIIGIVIDPYRIFRGNNTSRINIERPDMPDFSSITAKAIYLSELKPRSLIIGSSRSEVGLSPSHPSFKDKPVFNFSYPRIHIHDIRKMIEYAQKIEPLQEVILTLDFMMFNANMNHENDKELETIEQYQKNNFMYYWGIKDFYIKHLLSWKALKSALKSGYYSLSPSSPSIEEKSPFLIDGRRWKLAGNSNDKIKIRAMFLAYEIYYMFGDMWYKKGDKFTDYSFYDKKTELDTLKEYRAILRFAHRNNIKLDIVILPSHARLWNSLYTVGLWSKWSEWKKSLVSLNEEEATRANLQAYNIYDFSGFNNITTTKVPSLKDGGNFMPYYYDPSHFKKEVGDKVLDTILSTDKLYTDNFGVKLTSKNIDEHISSTKTKLHQWRENNPDDVTEIDFIFNDTFSKNLVYDPFLDVK